MKKIILLIIAIFLPCFVIAQGLDDIKVSRSGGSTTVSNSSGSVTISNRDIWDGRSSNSSSGGENNNNSYSSNSNSKSSNSFSNYDRYDYEKERRERQERERKANIVINNMNKLINNDCIDIIQIQRAIDAFNSLPEDLQKVQGVEGHNARAKLMAQKHNMEPIYNKYSLMAMNIREFAFGGINTRMMSLSYDDLDKYLKQFLNKHDFEQAKVEYQKYEKAKVLEREIKTLHDHSNDMKYLKENFSGVQKLKLVIKQQDALKYVDSYYTFLLDEIEKAIEYDEIKQISLTVSNIKNILGPQKATKNNANWKEIAGGMTSQRLLSVLGTLNSDNNNILPGFVREEGGYYLFVGEPTETDTKIVTKEYLVSKDGSEIEIYETEVAVNNDFFDAKANFGEKKVSIIDTSEGDIDLSYNAIGGKATLLKTDLHKQIKINEYRISEDGTILQYGLEGSIGPKSGISGSAQLNLTSNETKTAIADASFGAEVEAAHVSATLAGKWTPMMHINKDNSISFKQYSSALEGKISAGASAKFSISKNGVVGKLGMGVSAGISIEFQDIDGALKQIDSDVVLGIIKSSIDNNYYKSEFDDETIGKTVVSSIRKEVEKY